MRRNQELALTGSKTVLVPYTAPHVGFLTFSKLACTEASSPVNCTYFCPMLWPFRPLLPLLLHLEALAEPQVLTYHQWMVTATHGPGSLEYYTCTLQHTEHSGLPVLQQDPALLEATASEPLTLEVRSH